MLQMTRDEKKKLFYIISVIFNKKYFKLIKYYLSIIENSVEPLNYTFIINKGICYIRTNGGEMCLLTFSYDNNVFTTLLDIIQLFESNTPIVNLKEKYNEIKKKIINPSSRSLKYFDILYKNLYEEEIKRKIKFRKKYNILN